MEWPKEDVLLPKILSQISHISQCLCGCLKGYLENPYSEFYRFVLHTILQTN